MTPHKFLIHPANILREVVKYVLHILVKGSKETVCINSTIQLQNCGHMIKKVTHKSGYEVMLKLEF